jgi:hypothetical protein
LWRCAAVATACGPNCGAAAPIAEVPIAFVERREGTSKMSGRVILESARLPWRLIGRPAGDG